jgi:hypothetical protein
MRTVEGSGPGRYRQRARLSESLSRDQLIGQDFSVPNLRGLGQQLRRMLHQRGCDRSFEVRLSTLIGFTGFW